MKENWYNHQEKKALEDFMCRRHKANEAIHGLTIDNIRRIFDGRNDPVKYCLVYKNIGCSHVDGMLCDFPNCSLNKEYTFILEQKELSKNLIEKCIINNISKNEQ